MRKMSYLCALICAVTLAQDALAAPAPKQVQSMRCISYPAYRSALAEHWIVDIDFTSKKVVVTIKDSRDLPAEITERHVYIGDPAFSMIDRQTGGYYLKDWRNREYQEAGMCMRIPQNTIQRL